MCICAFPSLQCTINLNRMQKSNSLSNLTNWQQRSMKCSSKSTELKRCAERGVFSGIYASRRAKVREIWQSCCTVHIFAFLVVFLKHFKELFSQVCHKFYVCSVLKFKVHSKLGNAHVHIVAQTHVTQIPMLTAAYWHRNVTAYSCCWPSFGSNWIGLKTNWLNNLINLVKD